jgi:hypothetical protein
MCWPALYLGTQPCFEVTCEQSFWAFPALPKELEVESVVYESDRPGLDTGKGSQQSLQTHRRKDNNNST